MSASQAKGRKVDMGNETLTPKRLEEITAYLGVIGKELRTLETICGSMAAVRLLLYLVTHAGLRGVVTDSKDTIGKECSLTRGRLETARLELRGKFFIDFKTQGNKTRYTLDLDRIATAFVAAGIGRAIGQNQPKLTTKQCIEEYIPADLRAFAGSLEPKLDLEWFVSWFGPLSVRGGLKAMQGFETIKSPWGLLWKICNDRASGWHGTRTFPLETESPSQAEGGQQEPQSLGMGNRAGAGQGSTERAETTMQPFQTSAPSAQATGRLEPLESGPPAALDRTQEVPHREGMRRVYDFHVEAVVRAYRNLCTRLDVGYDSGGDGRTFVRLRLQERLTEAYLVAAMDYGIRDGVHKLADLCSDPSVPGNLQRFSDAVNGAKPKVRESVWGHGLVMSDDDKARIADILTEMGLNVEYFDLWNVYTWAQGQCHGSKVFYVDLEDLDRKAKEHARR